MTARFLYPDDDPEARANLAAFLDEYDLDPNPSGFGPKDFFDLATAAYRNHRRYGSAMIPRRGIDHAEVWFRDSRVAAITSQPYGFDVDDVRGLLHAYNLDCDHWTPAERAGWYWPGNADLVVFTRRDEWRPLDERPEQIQAGMRWLGEHVDAQKTPSSGHWLRIEWALERFTGEDWSPLDLVEVFLRSGYEVKKSDRYGYRVAAKTPLRLGGVS